MPTEGDNPNNAWIEHALQTVTQKLARGLSLLMTHATQRSSEDRVLVHHEAITEYLTSSSNGHAFPPKLSINSWRLSNKHPLSSSIQSPPLHTEEKNYYEFRLEPLIQMEASNEML